MKNRIILIKVLLNKMKHLIKPLPLLIFINKMTLPISKNLRLLTKIHTMKILKYLKASDLFNLINAKSCFALKRQSSLSLLKTLKSRIYWMRLTKLKLADSLMSNIKIDSQLIKEKAFIISPHRFCILHLMKITNRKTN
jgi:hypothetical protein